MPPKKGTAPTVAKTKPSRLEALLSATEALAVEQVPTADTMSAIEGAAPEVPPAPAAPALPVATATTPTPAPVAGSTGQGARTAAPALVEQVNVADIRPSPFQPKGRPSAGAVSAVRLAIAEAGSLDALASPEGSRFFARLDPEAARLAELAYDVLQNGMKTPVEVRVTEDGILECLSGHRRLAAASLAGIGTVPVLNAGQLSTAAAAATVLRGNLHRENFTSWQEAVLVAEVQQRRQADGYRDNVRTLGQVMGWSHGKANALLRIRKALAPDVLARVDDGDGASVEERLSRVAYRDLERLANEPDELRRIGALRQLLGIHSDARPKRRAQRVYRHEPKRGGGFVIEVNAAVETLSRVDAIEVRGALEAQLARVQARIQAIEHAG